MFEQNGLDLGGSDGESLVLDHFFAAIEDVEEAVGIDADDISGEVPAIAQSSGGRLRFLPISHHDLRAAHDELALLAGCDIVALEVDDTAFGEGQWLSDRGGAVHFRGRAKANVGNGGGFGHAVSLIDENAGEVGHAAREFGSEGGSAGFNPADVVVSWEDAGFGSLAEGVDRGWDDGHHGDALLDKKRANFLHVEARHEDEGGTERERKCEGNGESVDMVERQEAEHDVVGRERRGVGADGLINVGDEIVVREHDAFGESGGAAGVRERGQG